MGCTIFGTLLIASVPGNFIVEIDELNPVYKQFEKNGLSFNFTHKVNKFEFGAQLDADYLRFHLLGETEYASKSLNPLDNLLMKQVEEQPEN